MAVIKYSYTSDDVVEFIQGTVDNYISRARKDTDCFCVYINNFSFYVKKHNNYNAHGGVSIEEIETKINHILHELMNADKILGFRLLVNYDWDKDFWSNFGPFNASHYDDLDICEIGFKTDSPNTVVTIGDFLTNHIFITIKLEFVVR